MQGVAKLGRNSAGEVPQGTPPLVLPAVGQLMRQDAEVSRTQIRQKDVIAKRNSPVSADAQHQAAQPGRASRAPEFVYSHSRVIQCEWDRFS